MSASRHFALLFQTFRKNRVRSCLVVFEESRNVLSMYLALFDVMKYFDPVSSMVCSGSTLAFLGDCWGMK